MKTAAAFALVAFSTLGFFLLKDRSETSQVNLPEHSIHEEMRSEVQISEHQRADSKLSSDPDLQGTTMASTKQGGRNNENAGIDYFADILEKAIQNEESVFTDLEPLYERAYDVCNSEFNSLYGKLVTQGKDTETLPTTECLRIRSLLNGALDQTVDFEEKILLVEMLVRWEHVDTQLDFVRRHAALPPNISGVTLVQLEQNSLYHSSSINAKSSVIDTYNALSHEKKIAYGHEFFRGFVPLVLMDASQGAVDYFPELEAALKSHPVPDIPDQTSKRELDRLAEQMPTFASEEEFRAWTVNNPDAFRNFLTAAESVNHHDDLAAGALARVELATGLEGERLSPSSLSTHIVNEPDDVKIYHAVREIRNLSEHYEDFYRVIQQNDEIRSRMQNLLQNPTLSDGQRASVQELYEGIWG